MELNKRFLVILLVVFALSLTAGVLIGHFATKTDNQSNSHVYEHSVDLDRQYREAVLNEVKPNNMRETLRFLTRKPRLAGTKEDKESAQFFYDKWKSYGFDNVEIVGYDSLLTYPNESFPNNVQIHGVDGKVVDHIDITEPLLDPDLDQSGLLYPFLAYSASGSIRSDEIYFANYGRIEDFNVLVKEGFSIEGKIVICKYGKLSRGRKVSNAQRYGVKGVLIYDDPDRSAPEGSVRYPNGPFMPETGAQWGSLYSRQGDPATPYYPSVDDGYRLNASSAGLTTVIAQAISYTVAKKIFQLIDNHDIVPDDWKGQMDVLYTYGGRISGDRSISINVYNYYKTSKIYNTIGVIKGSIEPDRYVLIGNHRDTWSFGAIDATTGASVMLEVSRVLGFLKKKHDWRPKRSIVFCSWGGEEYAFIGSVEWVEEFNRKLASNAVLYVNIDPGVNGYYTFEAAASPLLTDLLYDVTKNIPLNQSQTVYSNWLAVKPDKNKQNPVIDALTGGSDYVPFTQRLGIPCVDILYRRNPNDRLYDKLGFSYPVYHTTYDAFNYVDKFIDPGFRGHQALAKIAAELLRETADAIVLPFNTEIYAHKIHFMFDSFNSKYRERLSSENITLEHVQKSIDNFIAASEDFQKKLYHIDFENPFEVRRHNDQLKELEKAFLDPLQTESRNGELNLLAGPSMRPIFTGLSDFPPLTDAIENAIQDNNQNKWDEVRKQLSIIINAIRAATSILLEPENFRYNNQQ